MKRRTEKWSEVLPMNGKSVLRMMMVFTHYYLLGGIVFEECFRV
jgi:hypothetical protein